MVCYRPKHHEMQLFWAWLSQNTKGDTLPYLEGSSRVVADSVSQREHCPGQSTGIHWLPLITCLGGKGCVRILASEASTEANSSAWSVPLPVCCLEAIWASLPFFPCALVWSLECSAGMSRAKSVPGFLSGCFRGTEHGTHSVTDASCDVTLSLPFYPELSE